MVLNLVSPLQGSVSDKDLAAYSNWHWISSCVAIEYPLSGCGFLLQPALSIPQFFLVSGYPVSTLILLCFALLFCWRPSTWCCCSTCCTRDFCCFCSSSAKIFCPATRSTITFWWFLVVFTSSTPDSPQWSPLARPLSWGVARLPQWCTSNLTSWKVASGWSLPQH